MHDGNRVRAVDLRMRVALVWLPVGRPSRVRDSDGPVDRIPVHEAFEHRDLAFGLSCLEAVAITHRDSRRIVAAILEALESLDEHWCCDPGSNVSDNSAHGSRPFLSVTRGYAPSASNGILERRTSSSASRFVGASAMTRTIGSVPDGRT